MANGQVRHDGGKGKHSEQNGGTRIPVMRATDTTPQEATQLMQSITDKLHFLMVIFRNFVNDEEIIFDDIAVQGLSSILLEILDKATDVSGVLEDVVNFYVESPTSCSA